MSLPMYRDDLPQLKNEKLFIIDGGLETHLVFHQGIDLPVFGSFTLMRTEEGTSKLKAYFKKFAQLAVDYKINFMLETPTWRGSRDWGAKCGFDVQEMEDINKRSVAMMAEIRKEFEAFPETKMVITGRLGPRGDGYNPDLVPRMNKNEAEEYHSQQINWFAQTEADMVLFLTANYNAEAIGAVRAAQKAGIPITLSYTLETDGNLPSGQSLKEAIEEVDKATDNGPLYYLINCAHVTHFEHIFNDAGVWKERVRGLQPNASRMSHSELEKRTSLDEGDKSEFGLLVCKLKKDKLPWINVLGGCCGTHYDHIESICKNSV